jgi:hypothetical protein
VSVSNHSVVTSYKTNAEGPSAAAAAHAPDSRSRQSGRAYLGSRRFTVRYDSAHPRLGQDPRGVLLAGRFDDPGGHQLLEHHVPTADLIEPELAIHRGDHVQQPTHPRVGDLQRHRLLLGRNAERQFVLPVRDPLRRDRLQHLHLGVGVGRSKMLDVT